jgi:hypothetical protein
MAVPLNRVPQRSRPLIGAGEYLRLAAFVIIEPLDAPLAGGCATLKKPSLVLTLQASTSGA